MTELHSFGLIPFQHGITSETLAYCGDPSKIPEIDACTSGYLDFEALQREFSTLCTGKQSCEFSLAKFLRKHLRNDRCLATNAKMYIQFTCDFAQIEGSQQKIGLLATTVTIIGCFFFIALLNREEKVSIMNYKQWDFNIATVADFSVQLTLTPKMWTSWLKFKSKSAGKQSFKSYLKS